MRPRIYTREFGQSLMQALKLHRPHPTLRQKKHICPRKTDLELFNELPVDDPWNDACLVDVYKYLRGGTENMVPSTWETAMATLDSELALLG